MHQKKGGLLYWLPFSVFGVRFRSSSLFGYGEAHCAALHHISLAFSLAICGDGEGVFSGLHARSVVVVSLGVVAEQGIGCDIVGIAVIYRSAKLELHTAYAGACVCPYRYLVCFQVAHV